MVMVENSGAGYEIPKEPEEQEVVPEELEQPVETQEAALETVGKPQEQAKQPPKLLPQDDQAATTVADDQAAQPPAPAAPLTDDDEVIQALPAKDGDLIEKEWVERAKKVIAKTADDPHQQKHEVSKMKAAYIQKRFNKAVKTDEAPA